MRPYSRKLRFSVRPEFCIFAIFALLMIPLRWVVAWILAALTHEVFHCIAILLCGGRVHSAEVGSAGAAISTGPMSPWKEILCALSGPLAGILAVLLFRFFPRYAICGAFQTLYNLLPVLPLDGGRALRCFLDIFCTENCVRKIMAWIQWGTMGVLLFLSAYAAFRMRLGYTPLLFWGILSFRISKIPCKESHLGVQ